MTIRARSSKKNNHEASEALSEVSRLLSRLAKSRKAPSKLQDIIDLTREVARLNRSFNGHGAEDQDDGYGDPHHQEKISKQCDLRGVIR